MVGEPLLLLLLFFATSTTAVSLLSGVLWCLVVLLGLASSTHTVLQQ